MAIERFPLLDTFSSATVLAVNQNNVDYRVLPDTFATWLNENLTVGDGKVTVYAAPTGTGFTIYLLDSSVNQWLLITPTTGVISAGTLVLPATQNCAEGQEITINCTGAITLLNINANGGSVVGNPSALTANQFFTLRYEPVLKTWYRVG
jgi:hypothetical protein